jgi:hypothetical protein
MNNALRRLSEQDLAQLYLQTQAPLKLDALLQGQEKGDIAQIGVHDAMSAQTPDLALISLSLCALVVGRDFPLVLKDGACGPVLREMLVACEDNLLTVGRLWLDSVLNEIAPDPKADKETILSIPDRLRILTSIFMELRDELDADDADQRALHQALNALYYQSESHADLADKYVEGLTAPKKKKVAATAGRRVVPDQIPLPFDLNRPREGAQVVAFSLFRKQ